MAQIFLPGKRNWNTSVSRHEIDVFDQQAWHLTGITMRPIGLWGVISANINFQILLCHSPMLLCSFLRNSYMHVRILLFPFEFCYLLFWFYYAIMNSFIQFWILLFAFELCYAVVQFYDSIVQFSHAVSNPIFLFSYFVIHFSNSIMPIAILLFSFQFYYSLSNYVLPNPGLS